MLRRHFLTGTVAAVAATSFSALPALALTPARARTLVDALLRQGQVFRANQQVGELLMDTNPLERERG
mgnify:CR=1 FL=1